MSSMLGTQQVSALYIGHHQVVLKLFKELYKLRVGCPGGKDLLPSRTPHTHFVQFLDKFKVQPDDGQYTRPKRVVVYPMYSFIHQYPALRPVWQEPEFSQVTSMALARCILGKFLRARLPLLSPAFRRSHFCRQVPPRPQRRERS